MEDESKSPPRAANNEIERILQLYNNGTVLFPRKVLEDLNRQLKQAKDHVFIDDFDGCQRKHSIEAPSSMDQTGYTLQISYRSIETLTILNPFQLEYYSRTWQSPISIYFCGREEEKPHYTFAEASRELRRHRRSWSNSRTCESLISSISSTSFPVSVGKIVCFGLGSLRLLDGQAATRSFWQHLAAATMTRTLAKANGTQLLCYCQDPYYDDFDKDVLRSMDIVPINDPEGFLAIDGETLVFSVNPNVPVKQIVSDVAWPCAMLWNTVTPESRDNLEWQEISSPDGQDKWWNAPFTTDPDSPRVRSMIDHYNNYIFQDTDGQFGDLTLYVKKLPDHNDQTYD